MTDKETISHSHDGFFKSAFSIPEITKDFVANYIPQEITELADLETL
ncbi:MAG: Rpn family recombination-promoting nuclease/putative transposase, partial [Desulfobacterales bacterium]|nr:Rpn family recombination-promoting nuclease/putative transposase [Desulfobacterales bacterium]MCP4350578.1 Rpn family recombination-promoting nuclease/putative transposase [Desulfobacterales bacterium]